MLALTEPVLCPAPLGLSCAVPTKHSRLLLCVLQIPTCIIPFSGYWAAWQRNGMWKTSHQKVGFDFLNAPVVDVCSIAALQCLSSLSRGNRGKAVQVSWSSNSERNKSPFRHHATSPAQANSWSLWLSRYLGALPVPMDQPEVGLYRAFRTAALVRTSPF